MSEMSNPPDVRIVFLGGLGEIGRNCFCIEVERPDSRRRLRSDVPRRRHAGHRPRPSRLHVPARERGPRRRGAAHARARRPRGRPRVLAPRHQGPDLRLCALARDGAQPHRGSRDDRAHRVHPGRRRRASPHRADRLSVRPGHALGAARLRDRVLHAGRHDRAHRRLQARPHARRRPAHRPRAPRRAVAARRRRAAACSRTPRTRNGRASRRRSRRSARRCARCSANTPTSASS